jgi:regulator of sigma E protease
MLELIIFFLILSALVLIHELGHFIAAKKSGVFVEEFGLGLPPRAWGKKIGETLYSLNWLPFGGFVKVYGEEAQELQQSNVSKDKLDRAFTNKSHLTKLFILVAGVCMNVFLSVLIFYSLLASHNFVSDPLILFSDHKFRFGTTHQSILITNIVAKTPAAKTALKNGDVVEGVKIDKNDWVGLTSMKDFIAKINQTKGQPILLKTRNLINDERKEILVSPIFDKKENRLIIGVGLTDAVSLDYSNNKVLSGLMHSYNMVSYHVDALGTLVETSVKEKNIGTVAGAVSGPIGILSLVKEIVKTSGPKVVENLLNLMAVLSLSLAMVNILPFPALDGGRAAFVLYEWVRGKKMSPVVEQRLNLAGFAFLLSLIALITLNDIIRIFVK